MKVLLPLSDELMAAIDAARGDVPRTAWIRRAIEERLKKEGFGWVVDDR